AAAGGRRGTLDERGRVAARGGGPEVRGGEGRPPPPRRGRAVPDVRGRVRGGPAVSLPRGGGAVGGPTLPPADGGADRAGGARRRPAEALPGPNANATAAGGGGVVRGGGRGGRRPAADGPVRQRGRAGLPVRAGRARRALTRRAGAARRQAEGVRAGPNLDALGR